MPIKTYDFHGESAYADAVPFLRESLVFLHDDDYAFDIALNEAVLNAAMYSVDGPEKAKIHLEIKTTDYDLIATVSCETNPCNMLEYRKQLLAIAARPEFVNADWTDYTADSDASRGIWLMLYGTEYIYMDVLAQSVRLCTSIPCPSGHKTRKMQDLLMRFFVEKDGVLL